MAINPYAAFPGKVTAPSSGYPYGKARNVSAPGDGTGTPLDEKWVNDFYGLQQQLLSLAGIVPSGVADAVGACQVYDALASLFAGKKSLASLTIEQFGGVRGDSSRSYAPEIQAALNASAQTGKTIRDSGTYYIKGTDVITVPDPSFPHALSIDSENLEFDFSLRDAVASSVVVTPEGVTGALMSGGGHAGPPIALPSAAYNSQTITATGLSVGDLLLIYSDDTREGDTSPQEIGELNYVQAVSGSTVTLESKLKDNYVTNPKYRVVTPLKSPRIKGLKLRGKGRQPTTRGDLGLFLLFCTDPYIDVEVDGVDQIGVDLIACKGGYMKGYGRADEKKAANGFVQYLYRYSSGTCDLTVDVQGRLSRHVCNGGSSVNIPGINRNVTVIGKATGTWHAAFSTHNGDELTNYDISADSCDMGLDLRVGKCTVKSLIANQCRLGLLLRKDMQDASISKVVAWGGDAAVSIITAEHVAGRTSMTGIEIDDIDSYDQETAITVNATVDPIPVQVSIGRIQAVRTSPSPGAFAAIRALGSVQLSVGEAKITDAKGYDVSAEAGAVIYIDTLEIQDHTSAPRILSADGAGSKIIVGRIILRGATSAPVIQTAGGGIVQVYQTVDMRVGVTQAIENTSYKTRSDNLVDGQLLVIPWPTGFVSGTVAVGAASSTVAGLVHARSGGSPLTVSLASLANFVVTSTDLTVSPPASGTGKITIGRSTTGFQIHAGGVFGVTTTFLG